MGSGQHPVLANGSKNTTSSLQVTGRLQPVDSCELGMADDAFDDQYEGCTEEMEAKAPQLLKEELEVNRILNEAWEEAKIKWEEIKNKVDSSKLLNDSHGIALVAYTGDISNEFNKAIRNFRQNTNNFQFKAFHYYLTRALQLLLPGEKTCYIVYRGCKTKFDYSGRGNVRFGQFASSSLSKSVAIRFSDYLKGTLFTIKTCLGVKIDKFSFYPLEEEVLIPGYEKYQEVTQNDNYISLMKPQISKSNYNCFYINSSGESGAMFQVGVVGTS